jgi:hypothetical protein
MSGGRAFAIIESEWRHLEVSRLSEGEWGLIRALADRYGNNGHFMPVG